MTQLKLGEPGNHNWGVIPNRKPAGGSTHTAVAWFGRSAISSPETSQATASVL
jgi:hypothetical protein